MENKECVNEYYVYDAAIFPEVPFQVIAHDEAEGLKLLKEKGVTTDDLLLEISTPDVRDQGGYPLKPGVRRMRDVENEQSYDHISDVAIYPIREGGYAIRCKIDGVQMSSAVLCGFDEDRIQDKGDWKNLAVEYFEEKLNAIHEEPKQGLSR